MVHAEQLVLVGDSQLEGAYRVDARDEVDDDVEFGLLVLMLAPHCAVDTFYGEYGFPRISWKWSNSQNKKVRFNRRHHVIAAVAGCRHPPQWSPPPPQ